MYIYVYIFIIYIYIHMYMMNFALRYGGNRTHAGANPCLIRSQTLTTRPTVYTRLVPNVPITCDGNFRYQSYRHGWPSGQVLRPYEVEVCSRVGSISSESQMQNSSQFLVPGGEFAWEHLPVHVVQEL